MRTIAVALMVAAFAAATAQPPAWLDPARVLVIYDTTWPDGDLDGVSDSLQVALAFQAARGVPSSNLVALACSPAGVSYDGLAGWAAFFNEVRNPVVAALNALGPTSIDTLLFCHGVPYALGLPAANGGARSLDQAMRTPYSIGSAALPSFPTYVAYSPYFEGSPGFANDVGHFSHLYAYLGQPLYLAARLDGVDVAHALDLIEGARYGDLYVWPASGYYRGNLYVDTRYDSYPNPAALPYPQFHYPSYLNADQDMAFATQAASQAGFPVWWENTASSLEIGEPGATWQSGAPAALAPEALFYYGWYNFNVYRDVWSWLPGSAACDLNSNSIAGIRSTTAASFLANAFQRGLTCGVGAIDEPYLSWHPFPETFIIYLLNGHPFAEAAAVSDQTLKWRNMAVGDPLYCPLRPGKVPQQDVTPPPVPVVTDLGGTASERAFRIAIDTAGTLPDLVTVGGAFGPAPRLDQMVAHGAVFRRRHALTLAGLGAGAFYRAALLARDPVGNETPVPEILFVNDGGVGPAAVAQSDPAAPAAGQAVAIEAAFRVPGGLGALTGYAFTVDVSWAAGAGPVDLVPLFPLLQPVLHGDPAGGETFSVAFTLPAGLPAGLYVFQLAVTTTSGPAAGTLALVVS